ncbi:MAG: glycoside hydrolase family 65 protein, partial [Bacteroidetes bacterium]
NVNNNWYTNKMASWTLSYTAEELKLLEKENPEAFKLLEEKTGLKLEEESKAWKDIVEKLHFPFEEKLQVFLQQDEFMDKEQVMAADLDPAERPINQHWSWDRILRSCFIKQADVLQGLFVFEDEFDLPTIKRNFDFYEPRTVHESSLSPCVHSILAARLGRSEKAYEMYLRTSRLDLDDYNHEVDEGLHITSMGGTWMSVIYGFGGMMIKDGLLSFEPNLPAGWKALSFKILYRRRTLKVHIENKSVTIENLEGEGVDVFLGGSRVHLDEAGSVIVER